MPTLKTAKQARKITTSANSSEAKIARQLASAAQAIDLAATMGLASAECYPFWELSSDDVDKLVDILQKKGYSAEVQIMKIDGAPELKPPRKPWYRRLLDTISPPARDSLSLPGGEDGVKVLVISW